MKLLEDAIIKRGKILEGNVLKVDGFINHLIDVSLICKLGKEFHRLFKDSGITKILTIEASGIGIACITAQYFNVPVLFAKKSKSSNISNDVYTTQVASFTHKTVNNVVVSKEYLSSGDRILIIDDFLAEGNALIGLIDLAKQAGAEVVGCGIVIEKAFQPGGDKVRSMGYRVESLARIANMQDGKITMCD